MNAAELHALVAPLLDRIGWPEGLAYATDTLLATYDGAPLWVLDSGAYWDGAERSAGISPAIAAALIRVHIEDRLDTERLELHRFMDGSWNLSNTYGDWVADGNKSESKLHALVAAGLAVEGVKA